MHFLELQEIPVDQVRQPLSIDSKLENLILYNCEIDVNQYGHELARLFEENLVLPGVILRNHGVFCGMLSRRRFLEIFSRRYGPELFLKRPICILYEYAHTELLILPGNTKIVDAIQPSLERSPELLYEPIIVRLGENNERLLDIHHLLLSHTRIHELTTKLLHEQTQSKMLQTEKMASLGEMVAGVAHEILNPVNFICGNLEYLSAYGNDLLTVLQAYEAEFPSSPTIDALKKDLEFEFLLQDFPKILSSMEIGSERLRKIISALRSFSHMDETVKRPLDIHHCLENTLLILNSRIKNFITLVRNYGPLPQVSCFSGQVSQVFTNLIGNAIDALTEYATNADPSWQPQITITTQVLSSNDFSDRICVTIHDNGPGIPADIQTKIFETFFTTKPVGKGTGFGLAIARQIVVEKHGGELTLDSAPGMGCAFTVTLPWR
ncbi:MAG: ATP-binding protein [Leptolyngbyaceae cyanobacterium bins.349]|nr:ATP-binding protein [Leptolyngbyaceae cyanobacterium bins.349]